MKQLIKYAPCYLKSNQSKTQLVHQIKTLHMKTHTRERERETIIGSREEKYLHKKGFGGCGEGPQILIEETKSSIIASVYFSHDKILEQCLCIYITSFPLPPTSHHI